MIPVVVPRRVSQRGERADTRMLIANQTVTVSLIWLGHNPPPNPNPNATLIAGLYGAEWRW